MTKTLTQESLRNFTGSESFFRHWANRAFLYTEGVHHVAEHGGAFWLIDKIALTNRYEPKIMRERFQHWKLTVASDHTATLVCDDGNDSQVFSETLEFTDFPLPEIRFYVIENEFGAGHFTMMLLSEY